MAGRNPNLKSDVKSMLKRGETTDFIASELGVSLQKVLSVVASLPIKKYTIYRAERSNVEHVMFLESKAFNEILDWNRPIYSIEDGYLLQERSGQWYGFRFGYLLERIGLNFGEVGQEFLSNCLPLLLRQGLTSSSDMSIVSSLKAVAQYQHIEITWNHFMNLHQKLVHLGDLGENLSHIDGNRVMKEHVAELLSEEAKDSPYSRFVDECITFWLNNDSKISSFRKGMHRTDLWVDAWLAICENPTPPPKMPVIDDAAARKVILAACSPYDNKVIDFMVDNSQYNSADVNLALNGKIKAIDIEFAKAGGFSTAKQVRSAKKLNCTTLDELKAVQKYKWESGEELREAASSLGLLPHERDLHVQMVVLNHQVDWRGGLKKAMVEWARLADKETMNRLVGFESPRSLEFFESVLLEKSEKAVRTDYLLKDYNALPAPGQPYDESSFESFLITEPFMDVVKPGDGGVSMISQKKQEQARKDHFSQS